MVHETEILNQYITCHDKYMIQLWFELFGVFLFLFYVTIPYLFFEYTPTQSNYCLRDLIAHWDHLFIQNIFSAIIIDPCSQESILMSSLLRSISRVFLFCVMLLLHGMLGKYAQWVNIGFDMEGINNYEKNIS